MNKIISLCLYTTQERYWRTFMACFIANRIAFNDFKIRLYASDDVQGHPQAPLLDALTVLWPNEFEYITIPGPYPGNEPSMWRFRPFWDENVDIFLSRDVDAVPIRQEVVATRAWLETTFPVHGMRSYHLHTCLLMAGMCGFRNAGMGHIRERWDSFEDMVEEYTDLRKAQAAPGTFAGDQDLLTLLFHQRTGDILDSPICTAPTLNVAWNMLSKMRYEAVDMSDISPALFEITEPQTLSNYGEYPGFAGKPIGDLRKEAVEIMERIDTPDTRKMKKLFEDHPEIAAYHHAS